MRGGGGGGRTPAIYRDFPAKTGGKAAAAAARGLHGQPRRPLPRSHEGSRMQTTAPDRDGRPADPAPTDDTGLHDLADLWRDLGGSD